MSKPDLEPVIRFSDKTREALKNGEFLNQKAEIWSPKETKSSFQALRVRRQYLWCVPGNYKDDKYQPTEVAFCPKPAEFWIPGTFSCDIKTQAKLVSQEEDKLREVLGNDCALIIPPAAAVRRVMLEYYRDQGVRLLGEDYKSNDGNWTFMMTSTILNNVGPVNAVIGKWDRQFGYRIEPRVCNQGDRYVGVPYWIVPR